MQSKPVTLFGAVLRIAIWLFLCTRFLQHDLPGTGFMAARSFKSLTKQRLQVSILVHRAVLPLIPSVHV